MEYFSLLNTENWYSNHDWTTTEWCPSGLKSPGMNKWEKAKEHKEVYGNYSKI